VKYTAYQAFKEALTSYYTGIAINVIHEKAEGETCHLDATAGMGILPLHVNNKPYPIFGSAIIPLITPTIGEIKFRRDPKPFKYVILAEENNERRALLRKVVQEVTQKLKELRLPTPEIRRHKHKKEKQPQATSRAVQIRASRGRPHRRRNKMGHDEGHTRTAPTTHQSCTLLKRQNAENAPLHTTLTPNTSHT